MANLGLIVADAGVPTAGDSALSTLIGSAHTVTMHSDTDSEPAGKDGYVIAESCTTADLAGKYMQDDIPMLVLDVGYWDTLDFTDAPNANAGTTETVFPHTITTGVVAPLRTTGSYFGPPNSNLAASAQIFLRNTAETHVIGWAFERGSQLFSRSIQVRMVAIAFTNTIAAALTAEGNETVLNALSWMLEPAPIVVPTPPGIVRRRRARRHRVW